MKFFKPKEVPMKIMVCYEESEAAGSALKLAQKYAKKWGSSIDVITAVKREASPDLAYENELEENFRAQIEKQFEP